MGKYFVFLALCAGWACRLSTPDGLVDHYANATEISNFVAIPSSSTSVSLTWRIPAGYNPSGIRILRKTNSFPINKSDGLVIFDGVGTSVIDSGLAVNTQYYYTAYAYAWFGYEPKGVTAAAFPNDQLPTLVSSLPADAATNVPVCSDNPCRAKIILRFSETMRNDLPVLLTTDIWNGSSFMSAPNVNSATAWSTTLNYNDTLTIILSWHWFPANSQIRYTIPAANLQDVANNSLAAQMQRDFTTTVLRQSFIVADTGQVVCSDNTAVQTCPFASYPSQDADFTNLPNNRSFIGPTTNNGYPGDFFTFDNVSRLTWKTCTEGLTDANCATGSVGSFTWYTALDQCSSLNSANSANGYAGITTWRLPTLRELVTLVNFGLANPAMDGTHFPGASATTHWSATISSPTGGRLVSLAGGGTTALAKTTSFSVRCVSSTETIPNLTYTNNGDGTVTDTKSLLRWQRCSRGLTNDAACSGAATTATWQQALQYCDTLVLGSFGNANNWRLPSAAEMNSLIDTAVINPSIDGFFFPGTVAGTYWLSTPSTAVLTDAFSVASAGTVTNAIKTTANYVRCVATGP